MNRKKFSKTVMIAITALFIAGTVNAQDADLQALARAELGIEFAPNDIGPFSDPLAGRCSDGWRVPTQAEMQWLISNGICKNTCYWLSDKASETFGTPKSVSVSPNKPQSGGTHYFRFYICDGTVDKFKFETYEYNWDGSKLTKNGATQHWWDKQLYVRCVRAVSEK